MLIEEDMINKSTGLQVLNYARICTNKALFYHYIYSGSPKQIKRLYMKRLKN